jgi:hypothetical protein
MGLVEHKMLLACNALGETDSVSRFDMAVTLWMWFKRLKTLF